MTFFVNKVTRTKDDILQIMKDAYEDNSYMLVGEQLIGPNDFPQDMLGRYSEASGGELPAIMGIDFGIYGMNLRALREQGTAEADAKWNEFLAQTVAYAELGGIVTASHHWANPTYEMHKENGTLSESQEKEGKYSARGAFVDGYVEYWDRLITEGDEVNTEFKKDLDAAAEFLAALKAKNVPVLFRPLHEANGNWFWFCAKSPGTPTDTTEGWVPAEKMIALWKYIYEYYTVEKGLDNLIWVYGPNNGGNGYGTTSADYYYPGHDYVDIVGLDWYTASKDGKAIFDQNASYEKLEALGKIFALTEFGPAGEIQFKDDVAEQEKVFSAVDFLNLMKSLTEENGMKCAYVLTWHEGYGAISSLGKAKEALADPFFCTLRRLNDRASN